MVILCIPVRAAVAVFDVLFDHPVED